MNKITIIYGPAEVGKSRLTKKMIKFEDSVCMMDCKTEYKQSLNSAFFFQAVEPTTTLIILDDVPFKLIAILINRLMADVLIIHKRGKFPIQIQKPRIIITVETPSFEVPTNASFTHRFDVIKLATIDDYYTESAKIKNSKFNYTAEPR